MSSKLMTAACALSLLCGTSAFAQEHHGGGAGGAPHGGGGGAPHGGGGAPHAGGGAAHAGGGGGFHGGVAPAAHVRAAPAGGGFHGATGGAHTGAGTTHAFSTTRTGGNRGGGNHGAHVAIAAGVAGVAVGAAIAHGGEHGGAGGGHHYSPQAFPHEVRPSQQYHYQGAWRQPQGYYYRHWGYGDRLPGGWFAQSFWLTNFWAYGLTAPPYDYAWVREGPDALLVNVYTGTVVEAEYGVFY